MEVQARTTPLPEPTSTDPEPVETPADYQTQATSQHEGSGSASILTGQSVHIHHPKLEKLAVEDDVEHFLTTFERIAAACRWPESDWIFHLIPLLTGKARSAYVNMDVDDSLQYEKVWIKEHNPKSAAEAATLADVFVAARSKSQPWSNSAWKAARDSRRSQPPQHPQRVGFPQEILTDQGTNFMSTLLKQVYKLLGIRSVRTTPYHPQTDGLTERFNQTLKQMRRKFVNDTGSDWDQWLPYLLFAYREVPQASTGFSPFELLYGHEVRGPLTLLKDSWEGEQGKEESVSVISYVIHMREKLQQMSELAQSHMAAAQKQQKTLFDRKARHRSFVPGQKVLVMLPTSDSKLLAKWQGPFEVQKKLGPTTYKVSTPGLQRGSRVLHVNLLKEWIPRTENKTEGLLIHSVDEEEEVNDYLPSVTASVLDLSHLTSEQQSQVTPLIDSDIFQKYPGRTSLVEHDIVLKPDAAVKRMSYRIPERFLVELKEEVDLMLSLGIIQPSTRILASTSH
ncbi:unnamed protein product [Oreochromis niloticus]|nr:unnamed protein product [Mustela putorius furo]